MASDGTGITSLLPAPAHGFGESAVGNGDHHHGRAEMARDDETRQNRLRGDETNHGRRSRTRSDSGNRPPDMTAGPPELPTPEPWAAIWQGLGRAILADRTFPQATDDPFPVGMTPEEGEGTTPAPRGMSVLVRMFCHHEHMDSRAITEALAPLNVSDLEHIGLVRADGTRVTALFGIERLGRVLVLHDWTEWRHDPQYVMGVTTAARSLAFATPRGPVDTVLDLGTGSGVQAVSAAAHADHVVAVDVNDRAVNLARASVQLNGIANVEVRQGSWFEPVGDALFDLVVANPPFVISPENRLIYRDGDQEADALCGVLLSDIPAHLAPGGFAVMLVEWARRRGEEWWSTPSRWLEALAADGLAVRYGSVDPRQYALRWLQASIRDPSKIDHEVRAWLRYYDRLGLDQMYEGVVALLDGGGEATRTPGHWVIGASRVLDGPGGDQLRRVLAGHVATEGVGHADLMGRVPRLCNGHSLFQELRFEDDRYVVGQIRGGFDHGLGVDVVIAPDELALVLSFDGQRPLGAIVAALSPNETIDQDRAAAVVSRLARAGLLTID
jgi:Methyltransferase small domain